MYLGDYIVIEREIAPLRFACCCVSTGTPFTAEVDEDKRHLFSDRTWIDLHPTACRFLRPDGGLFHCTIHRDSPAQCKFYHCIVMRVLGRTGEPAGTITGTLALHSEDPVLRAAYNEAMREIRDTDMDAEERLQEFLISWGFKIQ